MKNKLYVQLLTEAKKHLWDGVKFSYTTSYICFALTGATRRFNHHRHFEALCMLKYLIEERLEGKKNVELWLKSKGVKNITSKKLQAHRLAWMNMLIKEFS